MSSPITQVRSPQTILIESMLRVGVLSISEIARLNNVSRVRVRQIRSRLMFTIAPLEEGGTSTARVTDSQVPLLLAGMKTLNLHLTPASYAALIEACAASNIGSDEPNTIEDYAGEVLITHLQALGLIRRKRGK